MADLTIGLQTWTSFYFYKNETKSIISRGQYEDLKGKNMTIDLYFYKENNNHLKAAMPCIVSYKVTKVAWFFTVLQWGKWLSIGIFWTPQFFAVSKAN